MSEQEPKGTEPAREPERTEPAREPKRTEPARPSRAPVVLAVLAAVGLLAAAPWLVPAWRRYRVRRDVMRLVHESDPYRLLPAANRLCDADVDDLRAYWEPLCEGLGRFAGRFGPRGQLGGYRDAIPEMLARVAREDPDLVLTARAVGPLEPFAFRALLMADRLDLAAPEAREDVLDGVRSEADLTDVAIAVYDRACGGGTRAWEGWTDVPRHFALLGDVPVDEARVPEDASPAWKSLRVRYSDELAGKPAPPPIPRDAGTCVLRLRLTDVAHAVIAARVTDEGPGEVKVRWRVLAIEP